MVVRCPCGRFLCDLESQKARLRLRCVKCGRDVNVYLADGRTVVDAIAKSS